MAKSNGKFSKYYSPAGKMLAVLIIVAASVILVNLVLGVINTAKTKSLVKEDQYQAVFLENGQVYFGKLDSVNNNYLRLTEIYYLATDNGTLYQSSQASTSQVKLNKLGNEVHGPEDELFIDRDNVVIWENLKNDSKIVQAISDYKKANQ